MEVFKDIAEFRRWRKAAQGDLGFVPTMGALHAGHIKLAETSRAANPLTVVSIFVNPLQFGPAEDFSRYPRPFEEDLRLCREAGVTAVFSPEAKDFYATDHS